jgi:hypothetical protein
MKRFQFPIRTQLISFFIVFILCWETAFKSKVLWNLEEVGSWDQQDSNISLTISKGEEGSLWWAEDEENHPRGVHQLPGRQGLFHYGMKWQLHQRWGNVLWTRPTLDSRILFWSCLQPHLLNFVQMLKPLCIQSNLFGRLFCEVSSDKIVVVVLQLHHPLLML